MQITMRPMTVNEAWQQLSNDYHLFHKDLKKYGYTCWNFIPKPMYKEFNNLNPTEIDIKNYHDKFVHIYNHNATCLNRFDDIFQSYVKPMLERAINKFLIPLLPSWNAILPEKLEILCTFGNGAGYVRKSDKESQIRFRMSRFSDDKDRLLDTFFHEIVHILIENPIIKKYNVPQDLKERIVDLICYEFIQKTVQKMFVNSFANKYITSETIKTDLPGAVQKMMADYILLQQKQKSTVRE